MAQKVTVALIDDLDGGPAEETIRLGFEDAEYEIDLSGKNARAFRKQLAPFIEHARKARRGLGRRASRLSEIVERAEQNHPYEVPAISVRPIDGGNPDYLIWMAEETAPPAR
jgi:Lsr2/CutA1 divalent ion tolerance protein